MYLCLYINLKLDQTTNITIIWSKLKSMADDKINMSETEICFEEDFKHCAKMRKYYEPALSTFFHNIFEDFFPGVIKSLC